LPPTGRKEDRGIMTKRRRHTSDQIFRKFAESNRHLADSTAFRQYLPASAPVSNSSPCSTTTIAAVPVHLGKDPAA
jgi:hypothetical protein